MILLRALSWLAFIAVSSAQSATPSNFTYVQPTWDNQTVMMALDISNIAGNYWQQYNLVPLTSGAMSILPIAPTSTTGLKGNMYLTGPSIPNTFRSQDIAFISCDNGAFSQGYLTVQNVIMAAISANVSAIVYYAFNTPTCNVTGNYGGYDRLYAMTSKMQVSSVYNYLQRALKQNTMLDAVILSRVAFTNEYSPAGDGPAPGTAVAMIILYSITGLITALFLGIIITGAIRAHRHPERYGRRDFLGRPTQSRARGLARAILETLPIVKFGDQPTAKETGAELGQVSETTQVNHGFRSRTSIDQTTPTTAGTQENLNSDRIVGPAALSTTSIHPNEPIATTATSSDAANPAAEDSSLGCSICTDDFEKGQDIRVLPCSHKFHPACVDPWLLDVSSTCPLCRVDLRQVRTSSSVEENNGNVLAPPLRGEGRRARLGEFFANLRGVQSATPQERIAALRSLRMERRRRGEERGAVEGDAAEVDVLQRRQQDGRLRTLLRRGLERNGGGGGG